MATGWEGYLANGGLQGPIYGQNRQRTASNKLLESHRKQSSNGLQQRKARTLSNGVLYYKALDISRDTDGNHICVQPHDSNAAIARARLNLTNSRNKTREEPVEDTAGEKLTLCGRIIPRTRLVEQRALVARIS